MYLPYVGRPIILTPLSLMKTRQYRRSQAVDADDHHFEPAEAHDCGPYATNRGALQFYLQAATNRLQRIPFRRFSCLYLHVRYD